MGGSVLLHLHATADAAGVVVPCQNKSVADRHQEIHYADGHEERDGQHIREKLFPIHNC